MRLRILNSLLPSRYITMATLNIYIFSFSKNHDKSTHKVHPQALLLFCFGHGRALNDKRWRNFFSMLAFVMFIHVSKLFTRIKKNISIITMKFTACEIHLFQFSNVLLDKIGCRLETQKFEILFLIVSTIIDCYTFLCM